MKTGIVALQLLYMHYPWELTTTKVAHEIMRSVSATSSILHALVSRGLIQTRLEIEMEWNIPIKRRYWKVREKARDRTVRLIKEEIERLNILRSQRVQNEEYIERDWGTG